MDGLHFFELYIFGTVTCGCFDAKNVFKLNRLNVVGMIENVASHTEFSRRIGPYVPRDSTIDVAY